MKPPAKKHPPRARITSHLPGALRQRLAEYSAAKGVYECDVIAAALTQYLDGTSDMTLLYRRIAALQRQQRRQLRTIELHGEFNKEFVLTFLALTADVAEPPTDSPVQRRILGRYHALIERVLSSANCGKTWIDDLPKEMLTPAADADGEPPAAPTTASPRH